jgi:hypothetical protein
VTMPSYYPVPRIHKLKRIICGLKGHVWRFSFNHGIPLGCSDEDWDKLWAEGKAWQVDACERCNTQAKRLDNGDHEVLSEHRMEAP